MTYATRPAAAPIWAVTGDKTKPSDAYIAAGWPASIDPPPRQYMNWAMNYFADTTLYYLQQGLPEWDAAETYQVNAFVKVAGITYKSLNSTTNEAPGANPAKWVLWGFTTTEVATQCNALIATALTPYWNGTTTAAAIAAAIAAGTLTPAQIATQIANGIAAGTLTPAQIQTLIDASITARLGGVNIPSLTAAEAITANDAIQMGPSGKAWRIRCTDYASVANPAQLIAQTAVSTGTPLATRGRSQIIQGTDGSLFIAGTTGANTCIIFKYSVLGVLLGSVTVSIATTTAPYSCQLALLSNGSIVAAYATATTTLYVSVIDQNLNIVGAETALGALVSDFSCCALSAGGFAISWCVGATSKLAIYTNTCGVTFAAATINTWTGAAGSGVYTTIGQLSSGNIAIVVNSKYTTSRGTYLAIYSITGTQVVAMGVVSATLAASGNTNGPDLSIMTGYFCIARTDNALTHKAFVYSDAGALQGVEYSVATGAGYTLNQTKLLNDGTQFILITRLADTFAYIVKIPVTGGAGAVGVLTAQALVSQNSFDAYIEDNRLFMFRTLPGATANQYAIMDLSQGSVPAILAWTNYGTAAGTTNTGVLICGVSIGDFSFASAYEYVTTSNLNFTANKHSNTAIMGVATANTALGSGVTLTENVGSYKVNALKGSVLKAFDHTTGTNIQGNKGSLLTNAVVLRGM